jgi:ABC-type dipeptide/oligopeptide/nickel transport system ATPase component
MVSQTAAQIASDSNTAGKNVGSLDAAALRILRRDIQIIFQDPYASLDPRMNVGAIVGEALIIHRLAKTRRQFEERVVNLLETVGLQADHMGRYPNEFSGGQRQRIKASSQSNSAAIRLPFSHQVPDRKVSIMQQRDAGHQAKLRWTLGRLPFPLTETHRH